MKQKKYKEFQGYLPKEIPKLLAENRTIMSVDKLMQLRLDYKETRKYSEEDYVTSDAIIYHPNRKIKIVYDSQHIKELTPKGEYPYYGLNQKGLILDEKVYESLKGSEFPMKHLEKIMHESLDSKEAKSNSFWQCLARENRSLLNDYVDYVFVGGLKVDTSHWLYGDKKTKEDYRAFGINFLLSSCEIEEINYPILRACEICNLGIRSNFVSNSLWGEGSLIGISKDGDEKICERPEVLEDIDLSLNPRNINRFNNSFSRKTPALSYSYN